MEREQLKKEIEQNGSASAVLLGKVLEANEKAIAPLTINEASKTVKIKPNVLNKLDFTVNNCALSIEFDGQSTDIVDEYTMMIDVKEGQTITLSLGDSIKWANEEAPAMTAGKITEISVIDNLAVYAEF